MQYTSPIGDSSDEVISSSETVEGLARRLVIVPKAQVKQRALQKRLRKAKKKT